jgi:hypothetical protein
MGICLAPIYLTLPIAGPVAAVRGRLLRVESGHRRILTQRIRQCLKPWLERGRTLRTQTGRNFLSGHDTANQTIAT